MTVPLPKTRVVGVDISIGSFDEHIQRITALAAERRSAYVCCVNAHMTVEANRDAQFREVVNRADFATADGVPLTKALQWLNKQPQERVAGNDLTPAMFKAAEQHGLSVYLYGGQEEALQLIRARLTADHPQLTVAGWESPPFRPLSEDEMTEVAERINSSGANLVFVSLGCPKQERWMAAMQGRVHSVMLGVGGAFLLYAGKDTRAPLWMRKLCLEWTYRLALEPRRLWKRYLVTNTVFIWMFLNSWIRRRTFHWLGQS